MFVFLHEQTNLEKIVTVKMCQSIVHSILQGVHTPERPSSPAELYITEEEDFLRKNTKVNHTDSTLVLCITEVNLYIYV